MAELQAVKGNKVLTIDPQEKKYFITQGFDILEGGKTIAHGAGKTVPYAKYEEVVKELEALKAKKAPSTK